MNIQVILFDGFDPLDVIAPYKVFTAVSMYSKKEIIVEFVSAEGRRMVQKAVQNSHVRYMKMNASEPLTKYQ